jgi:hypothetical protein
MWIGLSIDTQAECIEMNFTWYDGTPLTYTSWDYSGFVLNCYDQFTTPPPYQCIYMSATDGVWYATTNCNWVYMGAVCEKCKQIRTLMIMIL